MELSGVAWNTVQEILSEQKQCRMEVCHELKELLQTNKNFFNKVIIRDESWYYGYDPEMKQK